MRRIPSPALPTTHCARTFPAAAGAAASTNASASASTKTCAKERDGRCSRRRLGARSGAGMSASSGPAPRRAMPRRTAPRARASALWSFTDTRVAPSKCMRKRGKAGLHNEARTPRKDAKPIRSLPESAGESRRAAPRAAAAPARRHPEASARRWRRRRSLSRARARRARVLQARATCQLLTSVLRADRHPLGGSPGLRRGRDRRGGRGWHG